MTIRIDGDTIHLEGHCRIEEAETLLVALQENGDRRVELGQLGRLHLALAQILLAIRPKMQGVPIDPFLRDWFVPLFRTSE